MPTSKKRKFQLQFCINYEAIGPPEHRPTCMLAPASLLINEVLNDVVGATWWRVGETMLLLVFEL